MPLASQGRGHRGKAGLGLGHRARQLRKPGLARIQRGKSRTQVFGETAEIIRCNAMLARQCANGEKPLFRGFQLGRVEVQRLQAGLDPGLCLGQFDHCAVQRG